MSSWSRSHLPDLEALRKQHRFARLLRRHTGLVHEYGYVAQEPDGPRFDIVTAGLSNLTAALPHVVTSGGGDLREEIVGGSGTHVEFATAWVKAMVEAAERYATMVFEPDDFIIASARELGTRALDLDRIPRCSAREYADPRCPLRPLRPDEPMRWVRGVSLMTRREVLVPAIMTHLYLQPGENERFWVPISTGVAAHTDLAAALVSALCEAVERDATALTWLTRRPLAEIAPPATLPPPFEDFATRLAPPPTRYHFFDATTDLGIPTVFVVQRNDARPTGRVAVSCATAVTPSHAYCGAIRESAQTRVAIRRDTALPADVADYHDLLHGAAYYARGGDRGDFDFLLANGRRTSLAEMAGTPVAGEAREQLAFLIERLRTRGMEALAIDVTPDEVREVGLWVVRVVVPDLVPVSFVHRARYLGTPRIYRFWQSWRAELPAGPAVAEENINPCPMPFA